MEREHRRCAGFARYWMSGCVAVILGVGFATNAHAQPDTASPDTASPDTASPGGDVSAEENDRLARELYLSGEADYAAGRYEQAAEKFKRAYRLSQRSALFFNLANAYERMGSYEQAAEYLKRYLDGPKVNDVVSVKERIRRLESAIEARKKQTDPANKTSSTSDDGSTQSASGDGTSRSKRDRRGSSRWPSYVLLSASGVAVASSVLFGLSARNAGQDAADRCRDDSGVQLCLQSAKDAMNREKRSALFSDLSTGVAVLTAGAGLYLLLRPRPKRRDKRRDTKVAPVLLPDGFGVGIVSSL